MRTIRSASPVCVLMLLAAACDGGGTTSPPRPSSLVALTATTQNAVVASTVPIPPAVLVSDERGRAMPGVVVTFAVTAGNGTVTPTATTDAGGIAVAAAWTTGTAAVENALTASVPGLTPVTFRVVAAAGDAAALEKAGGDGQSARVASALADSIAVRVVDAYGNGVPNVPVNFTASGGTLSAARVNTGTQGHARVNLTMPIRPGTIQVLAGTGSLGPQAFAVTVTAGVPAAVTRTAGEGQSVLTGTAVPVRPRVRVTDSFGNPVPGQAVTFAPVPGSGVVTGGAATTDVTGHATVGSWTLGEPGVNRLIVRVAALDSLEFTATSRAPCGTGTYTLFTLQSGELVPDRCDVSGRNTELYAFTVQTEQCVEFRMSSSQFDTYLFLLDNTGTVLAADDDSGGGLNSMIRWRLVPGRYFLGAAPYSFGSTGVFELNSTAVPAGEWCGNALSSARRTEKGAR